MNRKYKSDAFQAIHESAVANFEIGAIDAERMREYDEACLEKEVLAAEQTIIETDLTPEEKAIIAEGRIQRKKHPEYFVPFESIL